MMQRSELSRKILKKGSVVLCTPVDIIRIEIASAQKRDHHTRMAVESEVFVIK